MGESLELYCLAAIQGRLRQQRGLKPQGGRTVDIERFRTMMPYYAQFLDSKASMSAVLSQSDLGFENETIRIAVIDLEELLRPI